MCLWLSRWSCLADLLALPIGDHQERLEYLHTSSLEFVPRLERWKIWGQGSTVSSPPAQKHNWNNARKPFPLFSKSMETKLWLLFHLSQVPNIHLPPLPNPHPKLALHCLVCVCVCTRACVCFLTCLAGSQVEGLLPCLKAQGSHPFPYSQQSLPPSSILKPSKWL